MAGGRLTLVSVNLPVYHQLDLARRSVASICAQSYRDLEITLFDDGRSDEYKTFVAGLGDGRVRYQPNPQTLGAMKNMFHAIAAGSGASSIAFHEDDILGRHFVAAAVSILQRHPECGFVAAELREFKDEPSEEQLSLAADPGAYDLIPSGADFVRAVCLGRNPMFGSVVYRRAALPREPVPHEEFGTLVDRPFLLTILERWSAAIIRQPLVWYRHHPGDERHGGMRASHILRLFATYRSTLPTPLTKNDRESFGKHAGYWLPKLYTLLPEEHRPPMGGFLLRAWREGLYDPFRGYARKQIAWAVLTGTRPSLP
jgi:glycosyltransferase involved in cell wall biosynthesis